MFIVKLVSIKNRFLMKKSNITLKRIFLFLSIYLLSFYQLLSQDISFSDPYSEKLYFSPAYSALSKCSEINLNYNKKHISNYYNISFNKYFEKYKSGIGFLISNNSQGSGSINDINIDFIYSYKIKLNKKSIINSAFQSTYIQQSINSDNLIFNNQINPISGDISTNNSESSFNSYHGADFSAAVTYISTKYRTGIVIKHIDKIFIKPKLYKNNTSIKFHIAKTFYFKNNINSKKTSITPEIIYKFQDNYNEIIYGLHIVNNIFLTRLFIKQNIKLNTISTAMTLGINIKNIRLSYSYSISTNKYISLPNSSNQLSLLYIFNCLEKRNHKKTIFCSNF